MSYLNFPWAAVWGTMYEVRRSHPNLENVSSHIVSYNLITFLIVLHDVFYFCIPISGSLNVDQLKPKLASRHIVSVTSTSISSSAFLQNSSHISTLWLMKMILLRDKGVFEWYLKVNGSLNQGFLWSVVFSCPVLSIPFFSVTLPRMQPTSSV